MEKKMAIIVKIICIVTILSSILSSSLRFKPVEAVSAGVNVESDIPEAACSKLQVIVMIDHSTSMGGIYTTGGNDPLDLRFTAPIELANRLIMGYQEAYSIKKENEKPFSIKFSVVWFASIAKTMLEWTDINPKDDKAKDELLNNIKMKLTLSEGQKKALPLEIGTHTNFIGAFDQAKALFGEVDQPENGCPKRVIMVVTDGLPDPNTEIDKAVEFPDLIVTPDIPNDPKGHFKAVKNIVDVTFRDPGTTIYVTAIDNMDLKWQFYQEDWKEIVGEKGGETPALTEVVKTISGVGKRLDSIIEPAIGGDYLIEVPLGDYIVPPYVDSLVLTFFKSEKTDLLVFKDPDGMEIEKSNHVAKVNNLGKNEGIQSLEILRPMPGKYTLGTSVRRDDYAITEKIIYVTAKLSQPAGSIQQLTSTPIQLDLVDSNGNPMPSYETRYRLSSTGHFTGPNNYKGDLTLTHDQNKSVLVANFTPVFSGIYHVTLDAKTNDENGKVVQILNPGKNSFDLIVDPVQVEIGKPESKNQDDCFAQYSPIEIPFTLINSSTKAVAETETSISWQAIGQPEDAFEISRPDNGKYTLHAIPGRSGLWKINLTGSVVDPLDNVTVYPVLDSSSSLSIIPGSRFAYLIDSFANQPKGLGLIVERFFAKISGHDLSIPMVIGRSALFISPPISIHAGIVNEDTRLESLDSTLLPIPSLTRAEGKPAIIRHSDWQPDPAGKGFVYTFHVNRAGVYDLKISDANVPCGTQVNSLAVPSQIYLVPDVLQRILQLIIGLLILAAIIITIILLVCRFANPQTWYVDILTPAGQPVPNHRHQMTNTSCWTKKESGKIDVGGIYRLKISSVWNKRGKEEFNLYVSYYKISKKETKKEIQRKLNAKNGERFVIRTGFIVHVHK